MTQTTVAGNIQQTLDTHLHFRTQLTFHLQFFSDRVTDSIQFIIIPVIYLLAAINVVLVKNVTGSRKSNTEDIGKTDLPSFCFW